MAKLFPKKYKDLLIFSEFTPDNTGTCDYLQAFPLSLFFTVYGLGTMACSNPQTMNVRHLVGPLSCMGKLALCKPPPT